MLKECVYLEQVHGRKQSSKPQQGGGPESPRDRRAKKARKIQYSRSEIERLAQRVNERVCSDWWQTHAIKEAIHQGIRAKSSSAVFSQLKEYGIYPPPADHTPMRACCCENCMGIRLWPSHYIGSCSNGKRGKDRRVGNISFECYTDNIPLEEMILLPSSPGIVDIRRTNRGDVSTD